MFSRTRLYTIVLFVVLTTGCQSSPQAAASPRRGITPFQAMPTPTVAVSVSRLLEPETIISPTPAPSNPTWSTEYGIQNANFLVDFCAMMQCKLPG
jgi:hypothetical protein